MSIKRKRKKKFVKPIYIQIALCLLTYVVTSKFVFFRSIIDKNIYISFVGPFLFGVISSSIFLYLFGHEDLFRFMKEVEKKEEKQEKKLLKKYKHLGKVLAIIIISIVGGTILAALTTRILMANYKYKYGVLVVAMFLSTIVSVGIVKGTIGLMFKF